MTKKNTFSFQNLEEVKTRMHYSRIRAPRSIPYEGGLSGGCLCPGGLCPGGVSVQGVSVKRGLCLGNVCDGDLPWTEMRFYRDPLDRDGQ